MIQNQFLNPTKGLKESELTRLNVNVATSSYNIIHSVYIRRGIMTIAINLLVERLAAEIIHNKLTFEDAKQLETFILSRLGDSPTRLPDGQDIRPNDGGGITSACDGVTSAANDKPASKGNKQKTGKRSGGKESAYTEG